MPRFALQQLRAISGDTIFARGEDYARRGAVMIVAADARGVLAEVRGTETYRVRLEGEGKAMEGDCTCPACEREGWCKHIVAAALAVNAAGDDLPDRRTPIRNHLLGLGTEALADMLLDLASQDPSLLRRLEHAARAATATPAETAALLHERLRDALAEGDEAGYGTPGDWLDEVAAVVEELPRLIAGGNAADAKTMIDAILDDLPGALELLEDGSDEGMALLDRAVAMHAEACRALRPDPVELAQELFERETDGGLGRFDTVVETYADLLGDAGLAEYRRLAEAALARLPPLRRGPGGFDAAAYERRRLIGILDGFAVRSGDVELRIALRRAQVHDARSCLAYAQFCLELGRAELALQIAEDGTWLHEDDWNAEALTLFLAERLQTADRTADAEAVLWKRFARRPSFSLFQALHRQSGAAAVDRALDLVQPKPAPKRQRSLPQPDTTILRIQILAEADRLADAWALAHGEGIPESIVLDLAKRSERVLPTEAAAAYRRIAERRIAITHRHGYEEACRLLERLSRVEPPAAHREFVVQLRQRHKAKRSLLPMLDRHLATL